MTTKLSVATDVAVRSMTLMETADLEAFREVYHPEFTNRMAVDEPPACRRSGPEAAHATALWLRNLAADIHWEIHDVVADGDLVAVFCTMSGHQSNDHVRYGVDGRPEQTMPNRGRAFSVTQSHWLRMRDGLVIEHWANRDDIGMAMQLGWLGG